MREFIFTANTHLGVWGGVVQQREGIDWARRLPLVENSVRLLNVLRRVPRHGLQVLAKGGGIAL